MRTVGSFARPAKARRKRRRKPLVYEVPRHVPRFMQRYVTRFTMRLRGTWRVGPRLVMRVRGAMQTRQRQRGGERVHWR